MEVSEALARELGRLLYCDVGIEGVATWRLDDWSLVSFVATAIMEYRPDEITPTETFRRLAEASGGRWEGVDADEYVRRLRYEDDRRCF